CQQGYSYPHSF
nr:immunoglobulin light chain junction region [Macaca mulatta]MOV60949.1 immunoglobulin light chain junction region [Macaca mulatta]MOV61150.1 immunoglobulin light chain junction region [Macaca mulatta]MOV61163.1 immunoglobulin light chain junction region [Macaca mulatta]MOV61284.1 immunoglobulin light chain junction region [Macaca mulatta]